MIYNKNLNNELEISTKCEVYTISDLEWVDFGSKFRERNSPEFDSIIQTMYHMIESIRLGVGLCFMCVIITPLYIVKYIDDKIHEMTKPEYHDNEGI